VTTTPRRQPVADVMPPASGEPRSARGSWGAAAVALLAPLCVGGVLLLAADAARASSEVANDALYLGALALCLWLVSRRAADRALLRLPTAAALTGLAAGAVRCAVWLLILPVHAAGRPISVLAAVAGQVLLFAPAEEIQFRGIVLSRLLDSTRPWIAVALSAVLFTALHAYSSAFLVLPAVAADAILFTALRARYRCLGGAVVAHALFNAVTVALPAAAVVSTTTVAGYVAAVVAVDAAAAALLFSGAGGMTR
jgi:membrane protease YdiL (CAAX protease family)